MRNEIQTYEKLNDLSSIQALGQAIAESGMFGCNKPEQGVIIALQCVAENKPPLEMAKNYHIIKGKLTKRADSMLADFRKSGGKWVWLDLKNPTIQKALITFEDYDKLEVEYSVDDAKSAGVYNSSKDSPWQKTPAAMLRARCVSETLRAIAPEIVTGVYTPEEAAQFDEVIVESEPKAKPKPIKAKVAETAIVDQGDESLLEALIDEHKAESLINDYFINKAMIDGEQTWRFLSKEIQADMLTDFTELLIAARKVQA